MPFDRGISNNDVNGSSKENGHTKTELFSNPTPTININGPKCLSDVAVDAPAVSTRSNGQQTGFMSFFSARQRKPSGVSSFSLVSVKHSRLMCVAKIDESIQAIDDLLDFHIRAAKAENKVSNALWHTVQYVKSRKLEGNSRSTAQASFSGSNINILYPNLRPGASSSGDNSVVDSGISEMATETPFSRTNGFQSCGNTQAKQFLQCLVDANESRAEIAACRAAFHRKITTYQLQTVSDALQRLRSLYIELDTKLETYSSQLEADVRECWKKYAKYADSVTRQRSRLNSLLEKGMASKRKAIESSMNELDAATLKLHMAHNTYTLSLITARQYHQWLVTRLQPCLYRNLSRCLRLVDYAVSYLLRLARVDQAPKGVFDFISPPDADPLGDTSLVTGTINETMAAVGEDTFRRAFPFDMDLLVRAGDETLQPDKIIVNQMTAYPVQKLLQNHLQEVSNQGTITQVLENEHTKLVASLSSWISVLSSGGAILRDLPTALKTEEALTRLLDEIEPLSPLEEQKASTMDAEKIYLGSATKPATLCALVIQLGTCEFFHCQSVCFADSHAQIVRVLRQAEVVAPSLSTSTPPLPPSQTHNLTAVTSPPGSNGPTTGLDILESRFHCLRVQVDNQDGSISIGGRSSVCESDSENDISVQHQQNEATNLPPASPSNINATAVPSIPSPQRRSIKAIKEEFYRQSLNSLPKTTLTLTDNRSTNRHSAIIGSKALHRFQQNRFFKRDNSNSNGATVGASSGPLRSGTSSISSLDQTQTGGGGIGVNSISVESVHQLVGAAGGALTNNEAAAHRMDQDDVDINKEPWFHGVLPRTEVVRLLQNQGDFLVRETSKAASTSHLARRKHHRQHGTEAPSLANLWSPTSGTSSTVTLLGSQSTEDLHSNRSNSGNSGKVVVTKMVLSVYWNGHKHFIIQGGDEAVEGSGDLGNRRGGWSFEEYEFPTLRDLIEYHVRTGKPVTHSSGAVLLNPISRPDWQLDNKDVILLEKIGQGNFGEVHRGIYNGREVAVKKCRAGPAEVEIRRKFLQGEATALNFFHPNVVRLLGIAVRSHPIMIVMEYVAGGSLLSFLRRTGENADTRLLLRMCCDAANGMAYLESKNCIHRDLAARNCLLTEERVLKIADFGMAREEHVYEPGQSAEEGERKRHKKGKKLSDRNGPIPIKWTAPEALSSNRYTSKCDVWSFGILLWEIFSAGDTPYHGLTNSETRDLVENGYRLTKPDRMPRQLGKHMLSCWHQNPSRRPTFASLVISLAQLKREYCEEGVEASVAASSAAPSSGGGILLFESQQQHQQLIKIEPVMSPTEAQASSTRQHSSPSATASRLPRLKPVTSLTSGEEEDAEESQASGDRDRSPDGERF